MRCHQPVLLLILPAAVFAGTAGHAAGVFDPRDYGARGDGHRLDTEAVNRAVVACATAGGGQVRLTPGRYLCGTIHLRSHVTLWLEAGARLVGTPDLTRYEQPTPPAFMPEARWGKWHRALILAEDGNDLGIGGPGTIDGNRVFDPTGEERMRGPHTFVFVNCRDVHLQNVTFTDSANYAVFFMVSDRVTIQNVTFTGGWDGVHFRGAPGHDCHDVVIQSCRFYTGDDAIAGRYWDRTLIDACVINSSCNGIRLIGPAQHLTIHGCLFYGPGVRPHRTQDRTNMLAGINLQPGAWDATQGHLDDVLISDVSMRHVTTAFHIALKPGNTAGRIVVERASATDVYRAAASVESWAEDAFDEVVLRDVSIDYVRSDRPAPTEVRAPGVGARTLPAWGLYARGVESLRLEDVRLHMAEDDTRPALLCDAVGHLEADTLIATPSPAAHAPWLLRDVAAVTLRRMDPDWADPCVVATTLTPGPEPKPQFRADIVLANGTRAGLAGIRLEGLGSTRVEWLWFKVGQRRRFTVPALPGEPSQWRLQVGRRQQPLDVWSRMDPEPAL